MDLILIKVKAVFVLSLSNYFQAIIYLVLVTKIVIKLYKKSNGPYSFLMFLLLKERKTIWFSLETIIAEYCTD